jgi:nucleoside-diphosphate-sugar epimerase
MYMAGHKFGTSDAPELTWMMNSVLPSIVAERYTGSRTVVFSTGCVYSLTSVASGGSTESDPLAPPGEYAYSCIARERVFTHYAKTCGTPTLIFRLNYAIDLRYGVLYDIASKVWQNKPVDVTMGHVNVIWQGDANARALQSLALTECPPKILNVTGRECLSVRLLAEQFGRRLDRTPIITGEEADLAWLNNAAQSFDLLGDVTVSLEQMMTATADWVRNGGVSLGKPTHFESHDGKF